MYKMIYLNLPDFDNHNPVVINAEDAVLNAALDQYGKPVDAQQVAPGILYFIDGKPTYLIVEWPDN